MLDGTKALWTSIIKRKAPVIEHCQELKEQGNIVSLYPFFIIEENRTKVNQFDKKERVHMILNRCRKCRCPLDPGERYCEDCEKEMVLQQDIVERKSRYLFRKADEAQKEGEEVRQVYFKAERIFKNVGYWAFGGYDPKKDRGYFQIAVSPKGEPLKEYQHMREKNGRHVLNLVYPGCYILKAFCCEPPVIDIKFYKIIQLNQESEKIICEWVPEVDMTQRLYDRMAPAMDLVRMECITINNENNHYYWRTEDE